MEEKLYKVGDKVPQAGKYKCIVCGLIIEYSPEHVKGNSVFGPCPLCFSGTENGPKKPDEDFWKYIEE